MACAVTHDPTLRNALIAPQGAWRPVQ